MANVSKSSAPDPQRGALRSTSVSFRYATEDDARRILELRRGPSEEGLISATNNDERAQRVWLRDYLRRHSAGLEHYFMVCRHDGQAIGTARVHDIDGASCWWGSWVLAPASPVAATLESYILMNCFIFERMNLIEARFQVRAANLPVVRFHDAMRSPRVSATDVDVEYRVDAGWYAALKRKHAAYFSKIQDQL